MTLLLLLLIIKKKKNKKQKTKQNINFFNISWIINVIQIYF